MSIRKIPPRDRAEEATLGDVLNRLDAILNVILRTPIEDNQRLTIRQRVKILHRVGLRNREIARVLGISQLNVASVINDLRKIEAKKVK